jgi:hypothetical protein
LNQPSSATNGIDIEDAAVNCNDGTNDVLEVHYHRRHRRTDPAGLTAERSRGYRDTVEPVKEKVNLRLAELHGDYSSDMHGHALYLDGPEMRTTRALLQKGWPPERLHVPNSCKSDFLAMQAKATDINLYRCTGTKLLKDLLANQVPVTQDHSQSGASDDWVTSLQRKGLSPFSFVYLDYADVRSREEDLSLLLGRGLMKSVC